MRHAHFVAIGGTGMGSLAGLLKARGLIVTGSDRVLYPPMSTALESWGIPVADGFAASNVLQPRPDLVVMGTHGRSGLTRLLMGSVAEMVVRRAGCPVLTVKSEAKAAAGSAA